MNTFRNCLQLLFRSVLFILIVIIIISVLISSILNHGSADEIIEFTAAFANNKYVGFKSQKSLFSLSSVESIDSSASLSYKLNALANTEIPDWITVDILPKDCNSRYGADLEAINGIVIHYVGNPGISAENNRAFYDNDDCDVNSHFIVGLDGEIIQCLPLNEQSVASNDRNADTFSIEVCHPDEDGEFTPATYESLTRLVAWLCALCNLTPDDVIRHYDVNGKECPIYYVHNPDVWEDFKEDVATVLYMEFRH